MDKVVEDLLAVGNEFKNRRFLVHLLDSPFTAKRNPVHVDEDPINIMYDCNVVIRMRNLALMKATGPKRLPFI